MTFSKWRYLSGAAALALAVAFSPVPVSAQSGDSTVTVQGAQQSRFARLAIGLPETMQYDVEQQGSVVTLRTRGLVTFDFSLLQRRPLRQIADPRASQQNGQTIVTFSVPDDAHIRDFRSGQYLVIDVYSENEAAPQASSSSVALSQPPASSAADQQPASQAAQQETTSTPVQNGGATGGAANQTGSDQAVPQQDAAPEPAQGEAAGTSEPAGAPASAQTVNQGQPQGEAAEQSDEQAPSTPEAQPSVPVQTGRQPVLGSDDGVARDITVPGTTAQPKVNQDDAVAATNTNSTDLVTAPPPSGPVERVKVSSSSGPKERVAVSVSAVANGIQMRFPFPEGVASSVFERGGFLWLVFDRPMGLNGAGLRAQNAIVAPRIRDVEVLDHQDALVVRMSIRANQSAVVERDRNDWLVSLKDTPAKPRFPLVPERQTEGAQGQQIHIAATDLGRKIELEDPAVGDLLVVLPTLLEGRGLPQQYSYASSEVLETAQGIVIVPLSDFVTVERYSDGVSIRSAGNNILSASKLSRGTGIGDQVGGNFNRLIDFKTWRIGNAWEYRKNKARLLYELSLRPAGSRNDVRWKLARYFLAHGRGAECLGVLERMLAEDPLLAENSEYLAVRGVANFKAGRLEEAETDLSARGLEAEQDAELWRALVSEKLGHYDDTLEHYRRGKDVMGTYDDEDRANIQLAVVRASLEVGNLEQAQRELDLLNGLELTNEQLSESVYQSARIAERQGQMDIALAQFDDLADASQRWISARARYSRTKYNLRAGDITPEQAIDQLERLRYAWRGARFEIELIDDLAELYFQTRQYQTGLEVLRQGITYFPKMAEERRMLTRSSAVFRQLFLDGKADDMTPIAAISLYYDFRDLTPLGADGDQMIRRLSDRLVSVDLLERAAELLEYQVRVRTEGAARAQIAAKLAKIYILDEKPEEALQILRGTREPRLPQDIDALRRHVESRALTEMGRYEEAEVVIDGDRSADAETLRADIYWGSKQWPKLAATVRRILGDGWRRNETLTAIQRLNLIRLTIALTFTEDRAGLIEARRRYGLQMRDGDFANAFELLTNDQELSGRELGDIASQIASVEKLQSFMKDYRSDFSGR